MDTDKESTWRSKNLRKLRRISAFRLEQRAKENNIIISIDIVEIMYIVSENWAESCI